MARDPEVTVSRSGSTYLISAGADARVYRPGNRTKLSPYLDTQSFLAHCNVFDPWEPVPEADWPEAVTYAVADWHPPPDPR